MLLILIMIFITVSLFMISFLTLIEGRESPVDRIQSFVETDTPMNIEEFEKKERKSVIKAMGKHLEKIKILNMLTRKTSRLLIQADIPLTGEELSVVQLVVASSVSYLILALTRDFFITLVSFGLLWMMPIIYVKRKKEQRKKKFNDQLGDALSIFSNALKAGYSYLQAVSSVAKEMPEPISKEFGRVLKEMSFGIDATKTLTNMIQRVDSEDLKLMVTAIVIQKETGGNLAEILDNIAGTIRDRVRLQGEIKTLTAQGRFSGVIVSILPIALGFFIYLMNKPYMMLLFTSPIGKGMLIMAFINEMLGAFMISKITKIEV